MDIIVEGKITPEDGIDDVIQTVIDLKTVPNAILRVTDTDTDMQGRIAFSQGGYILGGRLTESGETGYSAVKKLLAIKQGNYAILDPGRQYVPEVNQSLWIKGEKLIELLPDLPENVEVLLDADPSRLAEKTTGAAVGHLDLKVPHAREDDELALASVDAKAKSRKFDLAGWRWWTRLFLYAAGALIAAAVTAQYGDQVYYFIRTLWPGS